MLFLTKISKNFEKKLIEKTISCSIFYAEFKKYGLLLISNNIYQYNTKKAVFYGKLTNRFKYFLKVRHQVSNTFVLAKLFNFMKIVTDILLTVGGEKKVIFAV